MSRLQQTLGSTFHLHLKRPEDVFIFDAGSHDPFDTAALGQSGIEHIMARARTWFVHVPPIRATIYLPPEQVNQDTAHRIHAALRRYCTARMEETNAELVELFVNSVFFLIIAIGIVIGGVIIQQRLPQLPMTGGTERTALSLAIDVISWVTLWTPVSQLTLEWYPLYRTHRVYRAVMDMDLTIKPEQSFELASTSLESGRATGAHPIRRGDDIITSAARED